MDFIALQIFTAVADLGGITAAARKLHRVQSNVTTRIRQLEESLGTGLFIREKRRLTLSPAGALFREYAEQILRLSEEARAAVAGGAPRGRLRVGTLESTAASRLPPLLSRYHGKHPAVRVELLTATSDALVEAVMKRELEAAFVVDPPPAAGLDRLPAFAEELVLVAPRAHPPIRRARDVRADTVIAFPVGCAYRRRLQAWLAIDKVRLDQVLELSSYHSIVACVASGTGIALMPRSVLDIIHAGRHVSAYPLPASVAKATTALVWRKGDPSPALKALQEEIGELWRAQGFAADAVAARIERRRPAKA